MDYGNIFRRSWNVIWNHKFMLVLGFLAALGSGVGSGGGNNVNYQMDSNTFESLPFESIPELSQNMDAIVAGIAAASAIIAVLICFLFVLAIILWLVRLTAQAGMIDAAYRLDAGEKVTFGEALAAGWQKLLQMIGLNVVLFGIFFLLAIVGLVVFLAATGVGIGASAAGASAMQNEGEIFGLLGGLGMGLVALICCLMCVFLLVAIVVSVIYPFAQRALVLENMGVIESIGRGWRVIKNNLSEVIVLVLIFLVLGFLVAAITFAVFLPVAALAFGPTVIRLFTTGTFEAMDIVFALGGLLCMGIIGAAINAIFVSFRSTVVTLAYGEFTGKQPVKAEAAV